MYNKYEQQCTFVFSFPKICPTSKFQTCAEKVNDLEEIVVKSKSTMLQGLFLIYTLCCLCFLDLLMWHRYFSIVNIFEKMHLLHIDETDERKIQL